MLDGRFLTDEDDRDRPLRGAGIDRHDHVVAFEDAVADHRLALDFEHVDLGAASAVGGQRYQVNQVVCLRQDRDSRRDPAEDRDRAGRAQARRADRPRADPARRAAADLDEAFLLQPGDQLTDARAGRQANRGGQLSVGGERLAAFGAGGDDLKRAKLR